MTLIDYPDLDDLDDQTVELLKRSRTDRGVIPAFTRMLAHDPAVLGPALGQFGEVVYGGRLEPDLTQLAFVVVSQANACAYCTATHGAELVNAFGLETAQLEALAAGKDTDLTDRQRAVAALARQAARDPEGITHDHVEDLYDVGFDDADVVELVAVVAQAAFANTFADALDIRPGDESPELAQYLPDGTSGDAVGAADGA